ncbi:AAA family ATPase [Nafulsella turpanensis]|uniref:AAA family ATPase n=1 Tax=Nafulsella turpanensis TaxID=1265690 RepID=UPI0003465749|nr:AAA family ATPase [Nafulsella turpanensis]
MDKQISYINQLAKQYKEYVNDENTLYHALNELDNDTLLSITKEYGDPDRDFRPVNVLRYEAVRLLNKGEKLTPSLLESIKDNIRKKNLDQFPHFSTKLKKGLEEYPVGNRDIFASWQNPWRIFHTFFFRGTIRETVNQYLQQIANQLKGDLGLVDYTTHCVDFYGPSNFGCHYCWFALYPSSKNSHQQAYQFFVQLEEDMKAGCIGGHLIKNRIPNQVEPVENYDDILQLLNGRKEDIENLNKEIRNYFKLSPGTQGIRWELFQEKEIGAVNYSNLGTGDISQINSLADLNIKAGLPPDSKSNQTWNLWLFKTANTGDVVFASKGTNTCLGVGIIKGDYYYDSSTSSFSHQRSIHWITDKVYEYKAYSIKGYPKLFRPDTFSPTLVWEFILSEYVRLYPDLAAVFDEHDLKYSNDSVKELVENDEEEVPQPEDTDFDISYWWLNANPNIWSINKCSVGDIQSYTSHNEKGNKRRIYRYFEAVKPGDLLIGYESSPVKQIRAIFEITRGLHTTDKGMEEIEFELIEKLEVPVAWAELSNEAGLDDCEVIVNNQGSLFKLSEDEFDIIRTIIDEKNIIQERKLQGAEKKLYNFSKDPDKPFIAEAEFNNIVSLLQRKKNIILQGPPGVGKTFLARKLAYQIMGEVSDAQIEMVQFHQSYSYEDFIQGLRPNKKGGFELKNGTFYRFCQKAHAHPERDYFLIIDEINRGNLSKIFGELMMLIEADKRNKRYSIKLTYAEEEEETFYVPPNLFLIGTMNTADRSLAIVDYALRRRFAFITLRPVLDESFRAFIEQRGLSRELTSHIQSSVNIINKSISEDINLGSGFQIGHSYFCTYSNNTEEKLWWKELLRFELQPLMEEIWFDNPERVKEMINILEL